GRAGQCLRRSAPRARLVRDRGQGASRRTRLQRRSRAARNRPIAFPSSPRRLAGAHRARYRIATAANERIDRGRDRWGSRHDQSCSLPYGSRRSRSRRSFSVECRSGSAVGLSARTGRLDRWAWVLWLQRLSVARTAVRFADSEADLWLLLHPRAGEERLARGRSLLLKLGGPPRSLGRGRAVLGCLPTYLVPIETTVEGKQGAFLARARCSRQ